MSHFVYLVLFGVNFWGVTFVGVEYLNLLLHAQIKIRTRGAAAAAIFFHLWQFIWSHQCNISYLVYHRQRALGIGFFYLVPIFSVCVMW